MYRYAKEGMGGELKRLNLEDCMECGCCSFVCPAKLPLTETFVLAKSLLKGGKRA